MKRDLRSVIENTSQPNRDNKKEAGTCTMIKNPSFKRTQQKLWKISLSRSLLVLLLCTAFHQRQHVSALAGSQAKKRSSPSSSGSGTGFGTKQSPTFVHKPDTSETTQRLLQFLKSQKAKGLDQVEIGYYSNDDDNAGHNVRGLYATQKFKKGQFICQIPSDCALALSDPSDNNNGEDEISIAQGGVNFLQMYWNNEQQKQFWSPYLDTLPKQGSEQFDPTPDFLIDDDLQLLEFPRIIQRVQERKRQIQNLASQNGMTVEELRFATWLVSSRAFQLRLSVPADQQDEMPQHDEKGQVITKAKMKSIRVMVPFIDMANHSSDQPNCKLTLIDPEKDEAWFALEATRPIAAGKELVISYGSGVDSSVELLIDYGFVPSSNRIDSIMLEKGGDDTITTLDGWTTTLEEDKTMLEMAKDDPVLQKILQFRIRLKESYKNAT